MPLLCGQKFKAPHHLWNGYFCRMKDGNKRSDIQPGMRVRIVLKQDQRSGKLTEGVVKQLLTRSASHPHGIKVRLENGQVGRVKEVIG